MLVFPLNIEVDHRNFFLCYRDVCLVSFRFFRPFDQTIGKLRWECAPFRISTYKMSIDKSPPGGEVLLMMLTFTQRVDITTVTIVGNVSYIIIPNLWFSNEYFTHYKLAGRFYVLQYR